jgi:competence protein ComEC
MSVDVHFLNVGHGDYTFVDPLSERLTMIDVNNSKSLPTDDQIALAEKQRVSLPVFKGEAVTLSSEARSWEDHYRGMLVDPVDYYRSHFDQREIFRYIQSHPDSDHMSGIHRFYWQEKVPLMNFWDIEHKKRLDEDDFEGVRKYQYIDWLVYQLLRQGQGPDEATHKVIRNLRGSEGSYWTEDGITILSPTKRLQDLSDAIGAWNEASYILRVDYGGRRVILPGDAEDYAWKSALQAFGEDGLSCDILKAAHHGRESGFYEPAVRAMSPSVVICSVGKKPETDASDEYASLGASVLSTRFHGSIVVRLWWDGEVWVQNHEGDRIASLPPLSQ